MIHTFFSIMTKSTAPLLVSLVALASMVDVASAGILRWQKRDSNTTVTPPKTVTVPLSYGATGNYMMPVDMVRPVVR